MTKTTALNASPHMFRKDASGGAMRVVRADVSFEPASEAEMKAIGDDKPEGYIAGWASTPSVDSYGDIVAKGAFDEAIAKRGVKGPKGVKFLLNHNSRTPGGVITVLETRGSRLWIEAQLAIEVSYVKDFWLLAKMIGGMSFSVGFYILDGEEVVKDERHYFKITKGDLVEVSGVTFPANEDCGMTLVKSLDGFKPTSLGLLHTHLNLAGFTKSYDDAQTLIDFFAANIELLKGASPEALRVADQMRKEAEEADGNHVSVQEQAALDAAAADAQKSIDEENAAAEAQAAEELAAFETEAAEAAAREKAASELKRLTGSLAKMRELLAPVAN